MDTTPPPPPLPPLPPTPPRLTFRPIDAASLPHLKSLNAALFPVAYRDIFYHQCMAAGNLTHGAFDGGELVGAVAVRLEARKPEAGGGADAYVMTVGVLAPYRGRGIGEMWGGVWAVDFFLRGGVSFYQPHHQPPSTGTRLLTNVLHGAAADPNIHTCYLHVQVRKSVCVV